jgi:hypothetical protein
VLILRSMLVLREFELVRKLRDTTGQLRTCRRMPPQG